MPEHILTSRDGPIQIIRLNRPDKKNALTADMYAGIATALKTAERGRDIRVSVITGAPGVFTAGNDLHDFLNHPPTDEGAPLLDFLRTLTAATKPLIAAVDGAAVGIGTTVLLHCDLVYLSDRARLQMPFVNLGLTPEAGATYFLPRLMGHVRAAELVMLGEPIDAQTAHGLGLANAVVPPEKLDETALSTARKLAEKPPEALIRTRALLKANRPEIEATMEREIAEFTGRLASPEAKEAFAAFLEKRKPDFSKSGK